MGVSKRGPSWDSIANALLRARAVGLSSAEVGTEITPAPKPIGVEAWVTFATPPTPVRVEGVAVAWTSRAVEIEYRVNDGTTRRVWVYASAVDRLPPGIVR